MDKIFRIDSRSPTRITFFLHFLGRSNCFDVGSQRSDVPHRRTRSGVGCGRGTLNKPIRIKALLVIAVVKEDDRRIENDVPI